VIFRIVGWYAQKCAQVLGLMGLKFDEEPVFLALSLQNYPNRIPLIDPIVHEVHLLWCYPHAILQIDQFAEVGACLQK